MPSHSLPLSLLLLSSLSLVSWFSNDSLLCSRQRSSNTLWSLFKPLRSVQHLTTLNLSFIKLKNVQFLLKSFHIITLGLDTIRPCYNLTFTMSTVKTLKGTLVNCYLHLVRLSNFFSKFKGQNESLRWAITKLAFLRKR